MKTLRLGLLLMPLLLLSMTRPAAAGPATVIQDGPCAFGWGGIDSANAFHTVLLPGDGVLVESNNARDNRSLHCGGQIDFGATTDALDIATGSPVSVRLLTIAEVCAVNPDACRGEGNGAVIFDFDNTGIPCVPGGTPSTKYSERVTPSGQAQITCLLPE